MPSTSASSLEVPLLDLSQPIEQIAEACRKACEQHGFLFLTNHGVPSELLAAHATAQQNIFSLSLDQKCTILADLNNRGYTPIADETLDPENSTAGDTKEGLYFGREVPLDSPDAALPLHGPNQWPDESKFPILQGYRKLVESYISAMETLGMHLLAIFALSLSLPQDYFYQYFQKPMTFLRPLHYPAIQSNESEGRFAAGAHTDYGFVTLLWTDGGDGLQVFFKGEWRDVVAPVPNAYIVNIGDMLERWTAGKFASTKHRVINPSGRERYSCPFFFEPSFDAVVSPLPGCGGPDAEERYPPVTSGQYLLGKYAATHEGYAAKMANGLAKIEGKND